MEARRRDVLRGAGLLAMGAGIGIVGLGEALGWANERTNQVVSAATRANGPRGVTGVGDLNAIWELATDSPRIALTFDDGPCANWTSMVLDILDTYQTPATFFMVGERLARHEDVIRGRMGRHEVGNHTWSHQDLSRLDYRRAKRQLVRAHEVITERIGVEPRVFRPPYGRVGGAALLAAAELSYQTVFWSRKMREATFDTEQQIAAVLRETVPGTILLAHDVGKKDRLVALRGLPDMIQGLRQRGFEFVTVSQAV